jgi:hypothetical protein
MRRLAAVMAVAVLAAGCSGPHAPLTFGGKAVPVNVSFGKPAANDPRAPAVPFALGPVPGGLGVVPVASLRVGNVYPDPLPIDGPDAPPCPTADPRDVRAQPRLAAGRDLSGAPADGRLLYRIDGAFDNSGHGPEAFRGTIARTVKVTAHNPDGSIDFAVTTDALGVTSTAAYAGRQANGNVPGQVGLASVKATGKGIDAQPSFSAVKPVTLMQLQPTPGLTWTDSTVDPLTGTTYAVNGKVLAKDRVDACGVFVDAWKVALSQDVETPFQQIHSEITDWFATQYGGLIVQELVSWHGTAGIDDVQGQYTATVDKDPGA